MIDEVTKARLAIGQNLLVGPPYFVPELEM